MNKPALMVALALAGCSPPPSELVARCSKREQIVLQEGRLGVVRDGEFAVFRPLANGVTPAAYCATATARPR